MTEKKERIRRAKLHLKAIERTVKVQTKVLRESQRAFAKLSKRKMRPGGGKPKGGKFEHTIADKIQKAFAHTGVAEGDVYRTKNSGAGKKQKGDIGLSSHATRYFPFTVECKHTKKFNLHHLFVPYSEMSKKWLFREWWIQLKEECKVSGKPGILIWRVNNCPDLCAVYGLQLAKILNMHLDLLSFLGSNFPHMIVEARQPIIVLRFELLLKLLGGKVSDGRVHVSKRNKRRVRASRSKP